MKLKLNYMQFPIKLIIGRSKALLGLLCFILHNQKTEKPFLTRKNGREFDELVLI